MLARSAQIGKAGSTGRYGLTKPDEYQGLTPLNGLDRLSTGRRALLNVVLAFCAIAIGLFLAEVGLRVHAYIKNGFTRLDETYTVDRPSGLRVPRAGSKYGGISISSLGFRGPEVAVPKPPGMIRLAFLGASTTFCAEVSSDSTAWPDIVTRDLRRTYPHIAFDYLNAGIPGYGIEAMQKNLELRVLPQGPDIVIIYEAANNLASDTHRLALDRGIIDEREKQWYRWIVDRSRLAQLIDIQVMIWKLQGQDRARARRALELSMSDLAWLRASYRDRMILLIQAAQRSAETVAVATFSHRPHRDNAPAEGSAEAAWVLQNSRAAHLRIKGLLDAYDAYNFAIRDAVAATGAVLIDGDLEIPGDAAHFVDTMHFTDAGSLAMARRVTARLSASLEFQRLLVKYGQVRKAGP